MTYLVVDYQWICKHCKETFQYSRAFVAHTTYGCSNLGSSTSPRGLAIDKTAGIHGLVPNDSAGDSSLESKELGMEYHEERVKAKTSTAEQGHWNERNTQRDTSPKMNGQSLTFSHSGVLSNPKLASLISSFSRPRFRKFANEPQSLAEFHKQEFRKKFQGNEHYLRRHLYREGMERRCATQYRRSFMTKEDSEFSLEDDEEKLHIKEEKDEFIDCFRDDYMIDLDKSNNYFAPSSEGEIFQNGSRKNASKYNFQNEHLPLNDSFNSHSNIASSSESKLTFITRGCPPSNGHESLRAHEEHLSRAPARECTCHHHNDSSDISKQRKSSTSNRETNSIEEITTEENEENQATLIEELDRNICRSNQFNQLLSPTNFSRLGSYFAYQRMHRDNGATFQQHLQCHCISASSLHQTTENLSRYHEPAFFVDSIYRYSTYPRMIPFFGHHAANSPQTSPRNQGFTCEYCGKVYCRKYVLKIHMRTHTGFKPLRCKVCDKSFSDPSNMKKHVKLHETEDTVHKCRHCGRNFVRYRGLLNHIKSKHSEHVSL